MTDDEAQSTRTDSTWVFLTNHAHVLLCVARDPRSRARDIADQVGITERATQRILADLIGDGYVARTKVGRRNHYEINPRGHLRHPVFRELSVGPLLEVLNSGADVSATAGRRGSARARR
jgi:predicted ArsR family transcriptional regulator